MKLAGWMRRTSRYVNKARQGVTKVLHYLREEIEERAEWMGITPPPKKNVAY